MVEIAPGDFGSQQAAQWFKNAVSGGGALSEVVGAAARGIIQQKLQNAASSLSVAVGASTQAAEQIAMQKVAEAAAGVQAACDEHRQAVSKLEASIENMCKLETKFDEKLEWRGVLRDSNPTEVLEATTWSPLLTTFAAQLL